MARLEAVFWRCRVAFESSTVVAGEPVEGKIGVNRSVVQMDVEGACREVKEQGPLGGRESVCAEEKARTAEGVTLGWGCYGPVPLRLLLRGPGGAEGCR